MLGCWEGGDEIRKRRSEKRGTTTISKLLQLYFLFDLSSFLFGEGPDRK